MELVYHPFRSAKAKERFLKLYDEWEKRWPLAFESRTVDTSYGQTFVRISGAAGAPPLILLHGIGGNSLQWIPNIEALSGSYRTYAVDSIYDCGRSIYTRPLTEPDDFVKWLDELFHGLALDRRISLAGLSYGGWQAVLYALRNPERVDKLVLLAPASTVLPLSRAVRFRAMLGALPHRFFARKFIYWLLKDLVRKDDASKKTADEYINVAYMAMRCFKPKPVIDPTVLTDSELQSIKAPVLFLVGENEKIYSAQKAVERLNKVAPRIHAEIIPHAGHDLTAVQTELVNRKILEFLKREN